MPLTNYGEASVLGTVFGNATAQPTTGQSWNVGLIAVTGQWTASTAYTSNQLVIPTAFSTTNRIFRVIVAGTTGATQQTWANVGTGFTTVNQTGVTGAFTGTLTVVSTANLPASGTITVASSNTSGFTTFTYSAIASATTLTITGRTQGAAGDTITTGANVYSSVVDSGVVWADVTSYFYVYSNISGYEPTTTTSGYARQSCTNATGTTAGATWYTPATPTAYPGTAQTYFNNPVSFGASAGANAAWGYIAGFFLIPSSGSPSGPYAWNTLSNFVPMLAAGMTLTLPATTGITVTLT